MTPFFKRLCPSPALLRETGVFAAFVLLSIVMTWPLLAKAATHVANVGIDDQVSAARTLREVIDWLLGRRSGLFDANAFFPHPGFFATTDTFLGIGVMMLPFRAFTDDYLVLVNLSILITFPLTAHATYLLVRDLTTSRPAGFIAGVAFGFCLYRVHQLDHLSILQMQWFVYSLVALHRLHNEPRWRDGALFAVFFFMNAISSANIALYTFAAYPFIGLWALVTVERTKRRRFLAITLASGIVALVAIAPFFAPFVEAREIWGLTRSVGQAINWSARVDQFHAAPSWSLLYGSSLAKYLGSESAVFLGFSVLAFATLAILGPWALKRRSFAPINSNPNSVSNSSAPAPDPVPDPGSSSILKPQASSLLFLVRIIIALGIAVLFVGIAYFSLRKLWIFVVLAAALFLVAILRRRNAPPLDPLFRARAAAKLYLFLAVLFAALSLGPLVIHAGKPLGPGPWTLLADLPGFGSVRTPSRLFFVTSMSAAILAGIGYAVVSSAFSRLRYRVPLFALSLAAVVVELWVAPITARKVVTLAEAPPVYRWLAAEPGRGAVAELPVGGDERGRIRRAHMFFGNIHGRPTVDDVGSFDLPVVFWMNNNAAAEGRLAIAIERLQSAGLDYLVLHRAQIPQQLIPRYLEAFAKVAARLAAEFGPDLAFALPKLPAPRPFAADSINAAIEVPPAVIDGKSLAIDVHLASRGDFAVFARGVHKLKLHATIAIPNANKKFLKAVYLAPPLFAAAHRESIKVEIPIDATLRGFAPVTFSLTDEKGATWASVTTSIAFTDRGTWDAQAARTSKEIVEGACAVRFVAAHRLPAGNATRVLFEVRNAGPTPWVASPAATLKIREARPSPSAPLPAEFAFLEDNGPRPEWSLPVPPLAPGANVLLGLEIPVRPFAIEAAITSAIGGRPCAETTAVIE